jgi:hypothetical protein
MSNESGTPVETKIIITHKAGKAMIGIQQTNCDPVLFTLAGNMATAITQLPEFIVEAERQWQTNPRYPKAQLPDPPPAPATTVTSHKSNSVAKPASKQQEAMF